MAAPPILTKPVEQFERNRSAYQAAGYNETQVRREFLDPFFKALGWDVDNEQGHAEAYKDVIHEDAIKVGGATKAPDYCFRIGGRRIFFLEAKKPSVNVREDVSAAFQLRRYAWSAKLPLSILSDFGSKKEIYQGPGGQWHLTTAEKKRILLNNIYGVDIDSQAVEVTKLSLLLKVLEHENRESLERQFRLLHERALPDLAGNIKCGNSLIGPDFYDARQMTLLDEEEQYRINAFDWRAEFPEVFGGKGKEGGFDAVIGNPPYIRIQALKEWNPIEVEHYRRRTKRHARATTISMSSLSNLAIAPAARQHCNLYSDDAGRRVTSRRWPRVARCRA